MGAFRAGMRLGLAGLAAGLSAAGAVRILMNRPVPPSAEELTIDGLVDAVRIGIDRFGVPHVQAGSDHDLFLAQGYLHARDRFFQMDLNRRLGRGRLGELFGRPARDLDAFVRRLRFDHGATEDLKALDAGSKGLLDAYSAGVNAYLQAHPLPVEYALLRKKPPPWEPADTLAFGRYMAWSQQANWESELIRSRLIARLGAERASMLEPGTPDSHVLPAAGNEAGDWLEAARGFMPLRGLLGGQSNSWVISPHRSATGHALLANDPHLFPRIPPVWYVCHLRGGGFDVIGASLPGLLGIIIGHNTRVAWGITAGMADTEDIFVDREEDIITGEDGQPHTLHGPVLNGTLGIPAGGAPIVLRSVLDDFPNPTAALLALNQASDWDSFLFALSGWHFPCLNFVYADVDGNVGYKLAGEVPLRSRGDGSLPVPGWDGEHEWAGFIPYQERPECFNPGQGLFATANSRPATIAGHFLTRDWIDDFRWRRIMDLLESRTSHDLDSMRAIQADTRSLAGAEVARVLSSVKPRHDLDSRVLEELRGWAGDMNVNSIAASVYSVFTREFTRRINWDLDPRSLGYVMGRGLHPVVAPTSVAFTLRASSNLLAQLELCEPRLVEEAFRETVDRLCREHGTDPARWRWGRLHRIRFGHPIGGAFPFLDRLFGLSRGPIEIGGDGDTAAQAAVDPWDPPAAGSFSVSYRQLLDLGDWDRGLFILPTGQSGHPGSHHYGDMLKAWQRGEYRPLLFSDQAIEPEVEERISLLPRA